VALIRNLATGHDHAIWAQTFIGRSSRAHLRLTHDAGSWDHATIRWDGSEWVLRDLKSRNGTWINEAGIDREWQLRPGDVIAFGHRSEKWQWLDGTPPRARAIRDDGVIVDANGALLLLPDAQQPIASLYPAELGWEIDMAGVTNRIESGQKISVGGRHFVLDLPPLDPAAIRTQTVVDDRTVLGTRLWFRVSGDEEHVATTIEAAGLTKELPSRAFSYMLLLLGRARLADGESGVAGDDAGWVYADELADQLKVDALTLDVHVHRARDALARIEIVDDAQNIIERRRGTRQLRLGIPRVQITTTAGDERTGGRPR
jgi:hypothetical protein